MRAPIDPSPSRAAPNIVDLTLPELISAVAELGQPGYRARQIWHELFRRLSGSFDQMSGLPASLRQALSERYPMRPAETIRELTSRDGSTEKALLRLGDGELIETVLMRYPSSVQGRARNTVCVSTQAGCAMACSFCATGQQGFRRNLSAGEILEQVLHFARVLRRESGRVTNIVFMGMGEPLANYTATLQAVAALNAPDGFGLGARHMTISTVGVLQGIRRLAHEPYQVGLALSLHAPNDELRRQLIPTARQPLRALIEACNEFTAATGRRYSVEYALIDAVNDSVHLAGELAQLLQGMPCHVNLIPVNPTSNREARRPGRIRVLAFQQELIDAGINCTVRVEKGVDIMAGCGQLRGTVPTPTGSRIRAG